MQWPWALLRPQSGPWRHPLVILHMYSTIWICAVSRGIQGRCLLFHCHSHNTIPSKEHWHTDVISSKLIKSGRSNRHCDTWARPHLTHPQVAEIQHILYPWRHMTGAISNAAPANVPYSHSYILTMYSQCQIAAPFIRAPLKSTDTDAFWHLLWIMWGHTLLSNCLCVRVCVRACVYLCVPARGCIFSVSKMSSHARLLDKACYGALRGTSRAGERTSEKAHSSVAIRGTLVHTASSRLDHSLFIPLLTFSFFSLSLFLPYFLTQRCLSYQRYNSESFFYFNSSPHFWVRPLGSFCSCMWSNTLFYDLNLVWFMFVLVCCFCTAEEEKINQIMAQWVRVEVLCLDVISMDYSLFLSRL